MKKKILLFLICLLSLAKIYAQTDSLKTSLSIETRVTNYFQEGYEFGVFWNFKNNLSIGAQIAAQTISGNSKELVFNSSNYDALEIRINYLVGFKTRYHFKQHHEGFYGELSLGAEEFVIESAEEQQQIRNGFLLPSLGYIWHPWQRKGVYINPNIGYDFILHSRDEKFINNVTYNLKSSFFVPAFSIGWKF